MVDAFAGEPGISTPLLESEFAAFKPRCDVLLNGSAYDNFQETRFMDKGGEWIMGCEVPLEGKLRGREKLLTMAAMAIRECMAGLGETSAPQPFQLLSRPITADQIPLLLCVAEEDRPGRLANLDAGFLQDLQGQLGQRFHPASCLISKGRVGGIEALRQARELLKNPEIPRVVIVGVDGYLGAEMLTAFEAKFLIQTSKNSDGFIPGEAAAALLLGPLDVNQGPQLRCLGLGFGSESATFDSDEPFRADGMVLAYKAAFADAACSWKDIDFRVTAVGGEQRGFKETSLALSRTLRDQKEEFEHWWLANCVGDVGAAMVPLMIGYTLTAFRKAYAPGQGFLCHAANDTRERAAAIFRYQ